MRIALVTPASVGKRARVKGKGGTFRAESAKQFQSQIDSSTAGFVTTTILPRCLAGLMQRFILSEAAFHL